MAEAEGEVVDVRRVDVHGVAFVDVTIRLPDGTAVSARLGSESTPDDLRVGERVLATKVANMIVTLRRPEGG